MAYPPQQPYQPPVVSGAPTSPAAWTPPPAEPAPKSRLVPVLLGILAVSILAVGGLIAALALGTGDKSPASTAVQPAAEDAAAPAVATTTDAPKQKRAPLVSEFALTPKIIEKQCFGSAGCNVDLEVKVTYVGPILSEDDTWQVTYELTGDESGPIVGSFEITGETYTVDTKFLSTRSSKTKISAKVTEVEKVGL